MPAAWPSGCSAATPARRAIPEQHVQLDKGVPVFITYLTANVAGGQLAFADDVYGLDPAQTGAASATAASAGSATAAH